LKRNYIKLLSAVAIIGFLGLMVSGCVFVLGGAVGAAGAYAISADTIGGTVDKSYDEIWDASIKVVAILGNVKFKDMQRGYIESEIGKTKVNVNIEKITNETTNIHIKARKYYKLVPDRTLALSIYTKIIQEAR
jgi:hypothetical protein